MVKCPFCQFDNEDGALFCEQCKSDLGMVEPAGAIPVATPLAPEMTVPIYNQTVPFVPASGGGMAATEAMPMMKPPTPSPLPQPAAATSEAADAVGPVDTMRGQPSSTSEMPGLNLAPPPSGTPTPLAAGATPKMVVIRGVRIGVEYPVYDGLNFIGRADEKPVDIDLEDQEPPDRIWSSRQHACISFENGMLSIEDLNSSNGTFVNRNRVYPGQKRALGVNDVVQIGTVQMKVKT